MIVRLRICFILFLAALIPHTTAAQEPGFTFRGISLSGHVRWNTITSVRLGDRQDYTPGLFERVSANDRLYNPLTSSIGLRLRSYTTPLFGFQVFSEFYSVNPVGSVSSDDVRSARSSKDLYYRKRDSSGGQTTSAGGIYVFAQAYIGFSKNGFGLKAGRFIFNSPLTNENDAKMIPNTFQGYEFSRRGDAAHVTVAYLTRQKLRDRRTFHSVIRYGASDGDNDDPANHRGLTGHALKAAGISSTHMIVSGLELTPGDKSSFNLFNYYLHDLLSTFVVEAGYTVYRKGDFAITPALKIVKQNDKGAGRIGGSSLVGTSERKPDALNAFLGAVRIECLYGLSRFQAAYSCVENRGDIVAPWRGHPTWGFTRPMATYNWTAGIRSVMLGYRYDLRESRLLRGFDLDFNLLRDNRKARNADSTTLYAGIDYTPPYMPGIYSRFRVLRSFGKAEYNYTQIRFEVRRNF
ncbi:hypothetical protein ACFL6I_14615 [candidate division KSB1 bacterium]